MESGKIHLDNALNPEFEKLISEYLKIFHKSDILNKKILQIKININTKSTGKKLKLLKKEFVELQVDYQLWDFNATNFVMEPKFVYKPEDKNKELIFLHFTNSLRFLINKLFDRMAITNGNYKLKKDQNSNQLNFNIAIFAVILSFVGLGISIISTCSNKKPSIVLNNLQILAKINKIESKINTMDSLLIDLKTYDKLNLKIKTIPDSFSKYILNIPTITDSQKHSAE